MQTSANTARHQLDASSAAVVPCANINAYETYVPTVAGGVCASTVDSEPTANNALTRKRW